MGRIENASLSRTNTNVQPQLQEGHKGTATEDDTSWLGHETYYEQNQHEFELTDTLETDLQVGEEEQVQLQFQQLKQNPPPRAYKERSQPVQSPPQNVQIQRPQPIPAQIPTNQWNSGLFDCMQDPTNALVTFCFPCLTFGQIAEIVDNGNPSCETSGMFHGLLSLTIWLPFIMSSPYRTKLRSRYNLIEDGPDCMTHFFCETCALCQEYRELQFRGFDPSIGWRANMQQQRQVSMMPPQNQQMMG